VLLNEPETKLDERPLSHTNDKLVARLNKELKFELTFNYDNDAFIQDPSLRYNPWSKTILGKNKSS
jgi:hypothetical protein